MSFTSVGKFFNAARNSAENVKSAARQSFSMAGNSSGAGGTEDVEPEGDVLRGRMAYIAVSRNEEMLAEVADTDVPEVEKDFAIALGRKILKRKAPPGWDEISTDRHRAVRFSIHDSEGRTSYTICFSHSFPPDRAQAFVQKLSLMLDPVIEKCTTITASLIESTILIILPVLERELERGNSGNKSYEIENQRHEINAIIKQNIEIILDREEKLSQSEGATLLLKKKTRTLKRYSLTSQVKWGVTLGSQRTRAHGVQGYTKDVPSQDHSEKSSSDAGDGRTYSDSAPTGPAKPSSPPEEATSNPSKSSPSPETSKSNESKPSTPPDPASSASRPEGPPAQPENRKPGTSTSPGIRPTACKAQAPPRPTPPAPAPKPDTPRTRARNLVGSKLSDEQATRAAQLILLLEPYVSGKRTAYLDDIWGFFDMPKPPGNNFREGDPVAKSLRGKMNRQRLLLHPDKNMHPDAERTFKFLEQCNQRLQDCCKQRAGGRETTAERTRREEAELNKEQERRRKEEEERLLREEEIRKAEEEKHRQEEMKVQKAEFDRQRIEKMLRDKENMRQCQADRVARQRAPVQSQSSKIIDLDQNVTEEPPSALPSSEPASFPRTAVETEPIGPSPGQVVGKLTLQVVGARDLPVVGFFSETNAYCMAGVGATRFKTSSVAGRHPKWNDSFDFDIRMEDQGLYVTVWREGWGFSLLGDDFLGRVEIPFLDLEDWSGCVIGRVIEGADPDADCMVLELKASIEWI